MKPNNLLLRIYGERTAGQWTLMCLDFSLAVQSENLDDAKRRLAEQISMYVRDATVGEDAQHAGILLKRRAPLSYWIKFYWFLVRQHIVRRRSSHLAENSALPLVPAAA